MDIVFIVIAGSFVLHLIGGLFVLTPMVLLMDEEKFDKLPIVRTLEQPKFEKYQQLIYYPILSILGGLFIAVTFLIGYIGRVTSAYVSYFIVFIIFAGLVWRFVKMIKNSVEVN